MSPEKGTKYTIEGRYFNAQGWAVAIVASVTHGIDWAAYIGSTIVAREEKQTVAYVTKYGCKLAEKDARYFFPELIDQTYRH